MATTIMLKSGLAKLFWGLAAVAFPLFFFVMVWISVSSGYQFRVLAYHYNPADKTVTLTRNVMSRSDVMVRSFITVTSADGLECSDRDEKPYEPFDAKGMAKTAETFAVPPELERCFENPPYTIVGRFQVKLGGWIPLKPTYYFEPPR